MIHYIDSSHYSQDKVNLVLNRILNYELEKIPQDLGVLITSENIESHLINNRLRKEQWRNNRDREVKLVEQVKVKLESK